MDRAYDAIVCGGSFGGLAAAQQVGGRVLVIDGLEIGEGETSASAVPLACLENMDMTHVIDQVHEDIIIHTRRRAQVLRFFPFCTFDYRLFCRDLFARTGAEFLRARIRSARAGRVETTAGVFEAPLVVDAAGWRTAAPRAERQVARSPRRSFGIESRQPFRGTGLHFYVGPSRGTRRFYWAFPAGDHLRAGLATYSGHSDLSADLDRFCHELGLGDPGHVHGGFFTSRLIDPVRDGMFLVGDSAGMCLPVSGEGIRPALVFGQVAGRLVERVRTGEMALPEALAAYRGMVARSARGYRVLDRLQTVLDALPDPLFAAFARAVASDRVLAWAVAAYRDVADPALLTPGPARDPLPRAALAA